MWDYTWTDDVSLIAARKLEGETKFLIIIKFDWCYYQKKDDDDPLRHWVFIYVAVKNWER